MSITTTTNEFPEDISDWVRLSPIDLDNNIETTKLYVESWSLTLRDAVWHYIKGDLNWYEVESALECVKRWSDHHAILLQIKRERDDDNPVE